MLGFWRLIEWSSVLCCCWPICFTISVSHLSKLYYPMYSTFASVVKPGSTREGCLVAVDSLVHLESSIVLCYGWPICSVMSDSHLQYSMYSSNWGGVLGNRTAISLVRIKWRSWLLLTHLLCYVSQSPLEITPLFVFHLCLCCVVDIKCCAWLL